MRKRSVRHSLPWQRWSAHQGHRSTDMDPALKALRVTIKRRWQKLRRRLTQMKRFGCTSLLYKDSLTGADAKITSQRRATGARSDCDTGSRGGKLKWRWQLTN